MFDDSIWYGWDERKASSFAEGFSKAMGRVEALSERLKAEAHREFVAKEAERVENGSEAGKS